MIYFSLYKGWQVERMVTGFGCSDNHRSIWNRTVGMGNILAFWLRRSHRISETDILFCSDCGTVVKLVKEAPPLSDCLALDQREQTL